MNHTKTKLLSIQKVNNGCYRLTMYFMMVAFDMLAWPSEKFSGYESNIDLQKFASIAVPNNNQEETQQVKLSCLVFLTDADT